MRIAIVGSRGFRNNRAITDYIYDLALDTVIVSGGCDGPDLVAERYARGLGMEVLVFPADWDKHGKAAGPIRNKQIVAACDRLVAFWDRTSRGTADSIMEAHRTGKPVTVILDEVPSSLELF